MDYSLIFIYHYKIYYTATIQSEYTYETSKYASAFVWMQYTGLKDKNGKEIYEGDVIARDGFFHKVIAHNGINLYSYTVNNPNQHHLLDANSIDEYDYVIGNIYENPELLK